ncbi:hypothetical protein K2173_028184 [Erythroxylum novogranatense]|uniref:Exonuclease domain-containing protein n=1 Tax=Erythroxylum novogranatense TaxID=1862640 RepID=A0AAV8U145_9ROSI|nr:hypothetical protein K2173_028184 [Erythroxylum novogranatense]
MTTETMMMVDNPSEEWPDIVFFDLETAVLDSRARDQTTSSPIVEFGAVVVCRRTLNLRAAYSTLVRPACPDLISCLAGRSNGITPMAVESAPPFSKIAGTVHELLHERIWAGHNILNFDCGHIKKAFEEIGESPPEAKGYIDTLQLWKERFANRTGDMKLGTIASYFGLGKPNHRSLEDAMTNLEVFKHCAALLWLELNPPANLLPNCTLSDRFLDLNEVLINSIRASGSHFSYPGPKMILMHKDMALKLFCPGLRVRYGLKPTLTDDGRLSLTFVIDASPALYRVLDKCDRVACEVFQKSGSFSDWKDIVTTSNRNPSPVARLRMPIRANGVGGPMVVTKIQKIGPCGTVIQEPVFTNSESDIAELTNLLKADSSVDAYVTLDPYDYMESAGVRIVAEKLRIRGE